MRPASIRKAAVVQSNPVILRVLVNGIRSFYGMPDLIQNRFKLGMAGKNMVLPFPFSEKNRDALRIGCVDDVAHIMDTGIYPMAYRSSSLSRSSLSLAHAVQIVVYYGDRAWITSCFPDRMATFGRCLLCLPFALLPAHRDHRKSEWRSNRETTCGQPSGSAERQYDGEQTRVSPSPTA